MKTYKLLTLALGAMISFNSCSDFLTTEMTDAKKNIESYYKTPVDALTALTGCYNGLDMIYNSGVAFPVASEVFSDNCFGGTGAADGPGYAMIDEFNKTVSPSDISMFNDSWKAYYQAVYRCNVLIDHIDGAKGDSSITVLNQYKAEAKFLRAYLYFDMVRLWGNIPLVLTPTLDNVPQAAPADVYAQIMSDLRYAADTLKAAPYNVVPSGRATKWAAESLLARVYLFYTGYYNQATIGGETASTALAAVEDVIKNSGHDLVSDFNTLWPAASAAKKATYAGETNAEIVFSIKYSSTDDWSNGTGNHWMVMEGIRGQSIYPYQYGWGACTVDPKLYNAFSSGDSRQFASIISIADESLDFTSAKDQKEYTGYYLKKYSSLCDKNGKSIATNFMTGPSQDYFVIRYSDVLLMAAELGVQLGKPEAQGYLDKVRRRAGLASESVSKATILVERRLEFVGEGIRYWDLLRQGLETAATTIANNTTVSIFHNGGTPPTAEQFKTQIIATKGLQQIPNDQITLSSGILIQNDGWK